MQLFWTFLIFNFFLTSSNYATPVTEQLHKNSDGRIAVEKGTDNIVDDDDNDWFNYDGRIVGGLSTSILNFPYQVSVQYNGQHICGGAIIRPNVIITAAHCVEISKQANAFQVRAGSTRHSSGGQLCNVQRIFKHERYSSSTFNYDIALMQLERMLIYSRSLKSVQLAALNEVLPAETTLLVSGWGLTSETGYQTSMLNYVDVKLIRQETCVQNYKYIVPITEEMFCAGQRNGGKDACQGDSGGPLVVNNRGDATLYGIVSWGVGCAQKNYPGVYAKVSAYRPWIDGKLAEITSS